MLGDDLLVAPVTEAGATEWSTYLPAGEWVDAWSGAAVEGAAWCNGRRPSTRSRSTFGRLPGLACRPCSGS